MIKCLAVIVAVVLFTDPAFGCTLGVPPARSFDSAHYIFIGEVVDVLADVPYASSGIEGLAVGFRIRVSQPIHPALDSTGNFYYDVFPLRLIASCGLMSATTELRAQFPIGSEVRVVAKVATVLSGPSPVDGPLRLETSVYNRGSFARNDLRDELRTSATLVYDYRTWVPMSRRLPADDAVAGSFYSLLQFELQKDLLRLENATTEAEKLAILDRLAFHPRVLDLDLPTLANRAISGRDTLISIERRWTQRVREFNDSLRPPAPKPDPPVRNPELNNLLSHLRDAMVGPAAIPPIVEYLDGRTGDVDHLAALVEWAQAGFPDLHDGYWTFYREAIKSGVTAAINYFVERLPNSVGGDRYLEALEALKEDEQFVNELAPTAWRYIETERLKASAFELMRTSDPLERRRGAMMVCPRAVADDTVWNTCAEALLADPDQRVRIATLYRMPRYQEVRPARREGLANLMLRAFLTDPSNEPREIAAKHFADYADMTAVVDVAEAPSVLAQVLISLAEARDSATQERLAAFAATMTTKLPRYPSRTIPSEALAPFIAAAEAQRAAASGAEPLIVQLWVDWWLPRMREYTSLPGFQ